MVDFEKFINGVRLSSNGTKERRKSDNYDEVITELGIELYDVYEICNKEHVDVIDKLRVEGMVGLEEHLNGFLNTVRPYSNNDKLPSPIEMGIILQDFDTLIELYINVCTAFDKALLSLDGICLEALQGPIKKYGNTGKLTKPFCNFIMKESCKKLVIPIRDDIEYYRYTVIGNLHLLLEESVQSVENLKARMPNFNFIETEDKSLPRLTMNCRKKTVEDFTNGKILSWKELSKLAEDNGYKLDGGKGDHAKYVNSDGQHIVIPQGRVIAKALHDKIVSDIFDLSNEEFQKRLQSIKEMSKDLDVSVEIKD